MSINRILLEHPFFERSFIQCLAVTPLGSSHPEMVVTKQAEDMLHVELTYTLERDVQQDDCFVELTPGPEMTDYWSFHLTPEEGNIAEQHVFRTPALIVRGSGKTLILLPDIETCDRQCVRSYMDMDAQKGRLYLGMSDSVVEGHVLYRKKPGAVFAAGKLQLNFYLMQFAERLDNPFRPVLHFFWWRYGSMEFKKYWSHKGDLTPYVEHTYRWAFELWRDVVWQQFEFNGQTVGAPAFIAITRQSPNYQGVHHEREFRSIWNQAWFCSLRSASGLFRHARRVGKPALLKYALMTKELALAFPQDDGMFNSVIATEMEAFYVDGQEYFRSKGWHTGYFGNSDRNPFNKEVAKAPRHVLDMSITANYMLLWYRELEQDERLTAYARAYADRLLALQLDSGFFPGWVDSDGKPMGVLDDSPESSMSAAFLVSCYQTFGDPVYLKAAERAMQAVLREVVPQSRYEDFETYWSCSSFWSDHVGEKIARNDMYKQCNFSMYFTALALLELYEATKESRYLKDGQLVLDELLMTQSSFQPASIHPPVIGGFGVLNADAELNDARQSLFAEMIYRYGVLLGSEEYRQRALCALRVGFSMMYCPENFDIKKQWEIVWPFLGKEDYGFMMENYGHSGRVDANGIGIGEFTIYDWGNGAASESFERMLDHYGRCIIDSEGCQE